MVKSEYLVVDTTAFIENANLQDIGKTILTVQNVVDEITSKRQLKRLVVLPYDLQIKDVFPENIAFITEFSKKTGDYPSLSATDITVMALVYQLEKEHVGDKHLNSAPKMCRTITSAPPAFSNGPIAGFFKGDSDTLDDEPVSETAEKQSDVEDKVLEESDQLNDSTDLNERSDCYNTDSLEERFAEINCDEEFDNELVGNILVRSDDIEDTENTEEYEIEDDVNEDDSDDGWITPRNVKQMKNKIDSELLEDRPVTVACITTDFAMQNVLKQIGLNIVALDGRVIKQVRTFILRCYACFKTTSIMTKVFCPKCGNKTLKKVSVSLDENGQQRIHINFSKPISTRGKRFSLPMFKGGKHAVNPIIVDRQPVPHQRPSRLAKTKNNPLEPDYIAGYSPFVMRDVNSKSAMLRSGNNPEVKYWMRKNPNEVRKTGKKKKKNNV